MMDECKGGKKRDVEWTKKWFMLHGEVNKIRHDKNTTPFLSTQRVMYDDSVFHHQNPLVSMKLIY